MTGKEYMRHFSKIQKFMKDNHLEDLDVYDWNVKVVTKIFVDIKIDSATSLCYTIPLTPKDDFKVTETYHAYGKAVWTNKIDPKKALELRGIRE